MAIAAFMKTKAYRHWSFPVLGAAAFAVLWLIAAEDRWQARVFADATDQTTFDVLGTFSSLDQCRRIAQAHLAGMGEGADYACALNCAKDDQTACEDTRK